MRPCSRANYIKEVELIIYSKLLAEQILKGPITVLFFIRIFVSFMKPVRKPDTSRRLITCGYIILNKTIPTSDSFSFVDDSLPLIGKVIFAQYCLTLLFFFLVYKYFGPFCLVMMGETILTFLAGLLRYRIRDKGFNFSFFITRVFVYFMRSFQGIRPQLFAGI